MAVQTYSINEAYLTSHYPQEVVVDANGPLTSARLTLIIEEAAAQVNGVLRAAGIDPAEVAADTASETYANVRRLIAVVARPRIMRVVYGTDGAENVDVARAEADARLELERVKANPAMIAPTDTSVAPEVRSSTEAYGISLTTETDRARDRYGAGVKDGTNTLRKRWW